MQAIYEDQSKGMDWAAYYLEGLRLELDEVAFANLAWCATDGNRYPKTMLARCFSTHTGNLLNVLDPQVVLLAGKVTGAFGLEIHAQLPGARIIRILHHAHRKGHVASAADHARVRAELLVIRDALQNAG